MLGVTLASVEVERREGGIMDDLIVVGGRRELCYCSG